jgi:hydrogenase nickel incorporation protein HypB
MKIVAAAKILKANDQLAAETRAKLDAAGVFAVNLVGSPGAGKTTLLEAMLAHWKGVMLTHRVGMAPSMAPQHGVGMAPRIGPPRPAVIEGDIAGSIDAERIEKLGVPVVQINTQGACHLDASMVAAALADLDLGAVDLLLIENVGNLVCTAGFDLGERLRVLVLSASEGDDKAVKYPAIFQSSQALCITKTDLLPQTNFDLQRITADYRRLAPQGVVFQVAAIRGEGIPAAADWLAEQCRR